MAAGADDIELLELVRKHHTERDTLGHPYIHDGHRVRYANESKSRLGDKVECYRVVFKKNALEFIDPVKREKYRTLNGTFAYVLSRDGHFYAHKKYSNDMPHIKSNGGDGAYFQHSSFFSGEPVLSAGTFEIEDPLTITLVTGSSGHYRPDENHFKYACAQMIAQGADGGIPCKYGASPFTTTLAKVGPPTGDVYSLGCCVIL